jgi:hypothetical protein
VRRPVDKELIHTFFRSFGAEAKTDSRVYLTGGVTAVLLGWRQSTVDLDIRMIPEQDSLFRAIPKLKESLSVNVEMASPADFLPELPGWQERSQFIVREGRLSFYHYDFYSQALSKVERWHEKDRVDVRELIARGLVVADKALELFEAIQSELYRFPAVDPKRFREKFESVFAA